MGCRGSGAGTLLHSLHMQSKFIILQPHTKMACNLFKVGYASMRCWQNLSQFASVEGPGVSSLLWSAELILDFLLLGIVT
jgi:hypothetical protein